MVSAALFLILAVTPCLCQRPSFAGIRPIGYPAVIAQDSSGLTNKFGSDDPLPPQLNGNVEEANRLDSLPVNQQPHWWINRKQYEQSLKNPQTYPQRPSIFNENINNSNWV